MPVIATHEWKHPHMEAIETCGVFRSAEHAYLRCRQWEITRRPFKIRVKRTREISERECQTIIRNDPK